VTEITTTKERPQMTMYTRRRFGLIGFVKKIEVQGQHSVLTATQVITYKAVCYNMVDENYHTFSITEREYHDLLHWDKMGGLIQDIVPDWSAEKREMCITGMNDEEFPSEPDEDPLDPEDDDKVPF